jgi:tetratricopeptide (TPR) repeat protein
VIRWLAASIVAANAAEHPAPAYRELIERGAAAPAFDLEGAVRACEEARALDPDRFEALACLAHMHNDLGVNAPRKEAEPHFLKGIEHARALQRLHPDRAESHLWAAVSAGNLALLRGGKEKVRLARDFERNSLKAIEIDPHLAPAYAGLGIYYREIAELNLLLRFFARALYGFAPSATREDSRKMLEKAVALAPADVFGHYQLGRTYESLKQPASAAEQYRKALELPNVELRDERSKLEARQRLARMAPRR